MSEFEADVLERLTKIQTQVTALVGNGQPGTISKMEDRLRLVENNQNNMRGRMTVISALGAFVGAGIDLLIRHFWK